MLLRLDKDMARGFCMGCKTQREIAKSDMTERVMKNGRPMLRGACPTCGTNITVLGGK